ncbi:hypothetical protein YC2023_075990 [Brassica napus]
MQEAPAGESRDSRERHREVMRSEVAGSSRQRVEELGERRKPRGGRGVVERPSHSKPHEEQPTQPEEGWKRGKKRMLRLNLHKFGYQKIHIWVALGVQRNHQHTPNPGVILKDREELEHHQGEAKIRH